MQATFLSAYSVYADKQLSAYTLFADKKLSAYTLYADKANHLVLIFLIILYSSWSTVCQVPSLCLQASSGKMSPASGGPSRSPGLTALVDCMVSKINVKLRVLNLFTSGKLVNSAPGWSSGCFNLTIFQKKSWLNSLHRFSH